MNNPIRALAQKGFRVALKFSQPALRTLRTELKQQRREEHSALVSGLVAKAGGDRLAGKVAVITGAGTGIGRATAVLFARQGAKVVVADIDEPAGRKTVQTITEQRGEAFFVRTDVSDDVQVEAMVRTTVQRYGQLNVLDNNAGILITGTVESITPQNWQRVLDVNLSSVYRCCHFAIPEMVKSPGGSIINTASVQGLAGFRGSSAYATSKGGVISLTRQIARDVAENGIRVNVICPGVILTPIFDSLADTKREEVLNGMADQSQLGTYGLPEDVAYAALYLASDESSFVTGTTLVVDGGLTSRGD